MTITKLGHCCLLIETKGKRIVTDPGSYTVDAHTKLTSIDFILFTHEHQDHFHLESLKTLLQHNPSVSVYANESVSALLTTAGIAHTVVTHGSEHMLGDVSVSGIGEKHAEMHRSIPLSSNLGYLIDSTLWYPGDAFTNPQRPVDVLALPVSGPWMKLGEAIDYALLIKPRVAFPVHEGTRFGSSHALPLKILPQHGITFTPLSEGQQLDVSNGSNANPA
jgi:L-ascorbate metabolism protein UlaG (beta-lactamase superfamily)